MKRPSTEIIKESVNKVKTSFTKDVIECSAIGNNWFVVSILNERGGFLILSDHKFNTTNGKLISSKTIEVTPIKL